MRAFDSRLFSFEMMLVAINLAIGDVGRVLLENGLLSLRKF